MAELSNPRTRPPLAEATNRINSPRAKTQSQKTRYEQPSHASSTHLASNAHISAILQPGREKDSEKRLSQASYDSNSSSRSKKNYKTHIGPWQLGRTLGKGSSARVRLCRHNVTNQLAAVKIVNRRMAYLVQDSSLAALSKWDTSLPDQIDGEMRVPMAIEREVAILKLIEHPHIMKLYDIWENRSEIYLILEYIDQGDLFTFINTRGRLTEEVTLYFFRQMISAITYCHSFNICHRDLKPENILITADLQIKIADFGMAALHQTDTHQLATACGSPHYAAPELLKNRQYRGDQTDVWSMGVILYAMLAATLPFDDPDLRVMMGKTKRGQYDMPKYFSPEAQDLVRRMLQTNPDRRITLKEIWRHPLVRKYDYLDNYGENNGLPPDTRKGFQYTPVPRSLVDEQLLRQLRSMWHMFSDHDLALKLTCQEPNDQKAFYWLLHNYREKQLEDFKPEVAHSMSDYHHLRPAAWKKRVSTCEFAQPRASGHGRSVSRFTVISNTADTEDGTVQSYDPYRGSRILQPCSSDVSHTKITVHRDHPSRSTSRASQATRRRRDSSARRRRSNSSKTSRQAKSPSSKGSMTSIPGVRQETMQHRRPSLRHKRGVDFSYVRKQPGSTGQRQSASRPSDSNSGTRDYLGRLSLDRRSESPELPLFLDGQKMRVRGNPLPDLTSKDPIVTLSDELRNFSSNIAKDCDEAFRSSLIEEDSIAASLADAGRQQHDSPYAFSIGSSQDLTPATDVSCKPWDSRPLPPLPSNHTLVGPSVLTETSSVACSSLVDVSSVEQATEHVARAIPVSMQKQTERRVVSAPAHVHLVKKTVGMPSINEDRAVNVMSTNGDKGRIVSAPPHTPQKKRISQARGVEYLSQIENSIRVVDSPSAAASPVKMPKPLKVRKKTSMANASRSIHRQFAYSAAEDDEIARISSNDSHQVMKKKRSWFKRVSRAGTESSAESTMMSHDQATLVGSDVSAEYEEAGSDFVVTKKKSFAFPFWKSSKTNDVKMMIIEDSGDAPETRQGPMAGNRTTSAKKRKSDSGSGRNIEVKQNWLARLFRVKPATDHLCMVISCRRARQEVTIILREWRRYGIRGVQVDQERNIVFARVGAKNYLNLKEVAFAAEIIRVIEHGKRQPLCIVRFTQERGAASSFHKVVNTMREVFLDRNLLTMDRNKEKMMIKTLNS